MITEVTLTKLALALVKKAPKQAARKLQRWVESVKLVGLLETREVPGYDDHALKGDRKGQRAIRLTKQWRAVYTVQKDGSVQFARVEEVHPHKY